MKWIGGNYNECQKALMFGFGYLKIPLMSLGNYKTCAADLFVYSFDYFK